MELFQLAFTCSYSTMGTVEQYMKSVKKEQKHTGTILLMFSGVSIVDFE